MANKPNKIQTQTEVRTPPPLADTQPAPEDALSPEQHFLATQPTQPLPSYPAQDTARRWPPEPQNYRCPSRLPAGASWLLATLASLLILSGLFLIIYNSTQSYGSTLQYLADQRSQATQTLIETSTAYAQGTAHVLGTMQASIEDTATSVSQANIQATATVNDATATANDLTAQYTQDTSGDPSFENDLLTGKNPGSWDATKQITRHGCFFHDGGYHANETLPGYLQPCIAEQTNFRNFTYQAVVILSSGVQAQAGLLFHVNSDNTAYYFYHIDDQGNYGLDLYTSQGTIQSLSKGQTSSLHIYLGQSNILAVSAQGQNYSLYANGVYLTTVSDNSLGSGKIGVAVLNTNTPSDATFRSAQVWLQI